MDVHAEGRMGRLAVLRLGLVAGAVVLAALYRAGLREETRVVSSWFFASTLAGYILSIVIPLVFPGRLRRSRFLTTSLIAVDLAVEGLLVWATGGALSVFAPLTFATVLSAATVLGLGGSLATATAATGIVAATTALWSLGWAPPPVLWPPRTPAAASLASVGSYVLGYGMALHAVALLSARLVGGLRAFRILTEEILQKMAEGLIAVDGRGRVISVNEEARKILRHSGTERLEGRPLDEVLRRQTDARVRELMLDGRARRMELLLEGRDGRVRPVEAKISVLRADDGALRCTVGIFSDLTMRKEAERATRRIEKLEELGEMALAIAHEIRNPLASIRGCAQEIARTAPPEGPVPRLVGILCRESDRLDAIIDDFLKLARFGAIRRGPVDLGEVLGDVTTLLRNRPEAGRVSIRFERPSPPARIRGDRSSLAQIFLNLGINALEAMPAEGGRLEIAVRGHDAAVIGERSDLPEYAPGYRVIFRDTGCGIERSRLDSIFTPFVSTKPHGTGLGLAVAQRIARAHRGWIEVESESGRGSVFCVWLPRDGGAMEDRGGGAATRGVRPPAAVEAAAR